MFELSPKTRLYDNCPQLDANIRSTIYAWVNGGHHAHDPRAPSGYRDTHYIFDRYDAYPSRIIPRMVVALRHAPRSTRGLVHTLVTQTPMRPTHAVSLVRALYVSGAMKPPSAPWPPMLER